jgi:hypothetical protein
MITQAPWTFVVVFMAIFVVLLVFAVVWLVSQGSSSAGEHVPSHPSAQGVRARRLPRGGVGPDERDEMPDERDGGYASSSGARPAEPVHS